MQATLSAEKRSEGGKGVARKMRAHGRVPAVLYGRDSETISLSVDAHEVHTLFHQIAVENTIIDLTIGDDSVPALVREIQVHPFRPDILHIDFFRIQQGVKVELAIPLHLLGIPNGVRHSGGTLQQVVHELEIKVLPSKIPESFEMDVTELEIGDSLHVSDIAFDDDVEILIDLEQTICTVAAPRILAEEEEEEEEEGELAETPEGEAEASEEEDAEAPEEG